VSLLPWPDHLLSLDEWEALPEDNSRYFELNEGVLIVSPRPPSDHQFAVINLVNQLHDRLPADLVALHQVEVVIDAEWPATVRVPDVIVVREALLAANPARIPASDVRLAIEVIWPGSESLDRHFKRWEYARARIPEYWILGLDPLELTAYRLVDGRYQPTPVTIDVASLLPHRA
jgi:Uma2 family endonuclease